MAAKTRWHGYATKLRHSHPMYSRLVSGANLGGWLGRLVTPLARQPISWYYYACDLSYFDVVLCRSSSHIPATSLHQEVTFSSDPLNGMVWYGMVNVDLYSAIITKVSNALDTLVSGEKPGFQTLSEGLVVLLCAEVIRQRVPDHGAVHSECSASDSG